MADYPNVKRWFDAIDARPAVQRGVKVLADWQPTPTTRSTRESVRRHAVREALKSAYCNGILQQVAEGERHHFDAFFGKLRRFFTRGEPRIDRFGASS